AYQRNNVPRHQLITACAVGLEDNGQVVVVLATWDHVDSDGNGVRCAPRYQVAIYVHCRSGNVHGRQVKRVSVIRPSGDGETRGEGVAGHAPNGNTDCGSIEHSFSP